VNGSRQPRDFVVTVARQAAGHEPTRIRGVRPERLSIATAYQPDPLDPPAQRNVLICCSRPQGDVVIDL